MKTYIPVSVLTLIFTFLIAVGNWWLVGGVGIGVLARSYSGHIISIGTGIMIGILIVEAIKFLVYKG